MIICFQFEGSHFMGLLTDGVGMAPGMTREHQG